MLGEFFSKIVKALKMHREQISNITASIKPDSPIENQKNTQGLR